MLRRSRLAFVLPALAAVLAGSCTDATGPRTPVYVPTARGDGQVAAAGMHLPEALVVELRDPEGRPLPDLPVRWVADVGDGMLTPAFTFTDAEGRASARWTLGRRAGRNTAKVSIAGLAPITFHAVGTAGSPARLQLDRDSLGFTALDDTAHVGSEVEDQFGNRLPEAALRWASSNPAVVEVREDGQVRARGNGTARLIASAGVAADTIPVEVRQRPASVTILVPADSAPLVGDTLRLAARVTDARGFVIEEARVRWTSSDASILEVDSTGQARARAAGLSRVTAAAQPALGMAELAVRLPALRLTAREARLEGVGEIAAVAAQVRGAPAGPLQLRVVDERRWLHDVPVLDAEALAAGEVRAASAGTATLEVRAAGAAPDTLTVTVTPRRSVVLGFVAPPPLSTDPILLRGYGLDRLAPAALRAGERGLRIVARDSANLWVRVDGLPNLACGTPGPLRISVAGAEMRVEASISRPPRPALSLGIGQTVRLSAEQAACLRLAPSADARYALAFTDTRALERARSRADDAAAGAGVASATVRDWTSEAESATSRLLATAGQLPPRSNHVVVTAAAALPAGHWSTRATAWQRGERFRATGPGSPLLRVERVYERFVLAVPAAEPPPPWLARLDSAMAGVLATSAPLLRHALDEGTPVSSPGAEQLLIVVQPGTPDATLVHLGAPADVGNPRVAPTLLLLDADSLATASSVRMLQRLTRQLTHAWQTRYLHQSWPGEQAPDLTGSLWANEATATLLAAEALRRTAGLPLAANPDADALLRDPPSDAARLYVQTLADGLADGGGFLFDLVQRRLAAGEDADAALREIARGALEGWYGLDRFGNRRPGLTARMRARLGGTWDAADARLVWALSQAVDDLTSNPTLQNAALARAAAHANGWPPMDRLQSGTGRQLELTWAAGGTQYLLLDDDDRGGPFSLAASNDGVAWMLVRYR